MLGSRGESVAGRPPDAADDDQRILVRLERSGRGATSQTVLQALSIDEGCFSAAYDLARRCSIFPVSPCQLQIWRLQPAHGIRHPARVGGQRLPVGPPDHQVCGLPTTYSSRPTARCRRRMKLCVVGYGSEVNILARVAEDTLSFGLGKLPK